MKYNFDNNLLNVLGLSNKNRYEIEYIIEIIEKKDHGDFLKIY